MSVQIGAPTPMAGGQSAMWVRSVQVGAVDGREYRGKRVETGIFKAPAPGPVFLGRLGPRGDQQADLVHHGGPDKAVLAYSHDHYHYWEHRLGRDPGPAVLGENLTVTGLSEETACIGDIYEIGTAVLQVSQPRVPCFKVNLRIGLPDALERVSETLWTGFYFRVLQEGMVAAGDPIILTGRPQNAPTVAWANLVLHRETANLEAARRLLATPELAESWKEQMRKRLLQAGALAE